MAIVNITIQQAYAICNGTWINPYTKGLLDDGVVFGSTLNTSFSLGNLFAANVAADGTMLNNRLKAFLSGTSFAPGTIPTQGSTLTLQDNSYVLCSTTPVVANSAASGFETPVFNPQEYIGLTRQNYNYRTGADFNNSNVVNGYEQLYHLAGLGLFKKIKK
jgi:hypothetical protein